MTRRHANNGHHDPNNKGENWPKFLRDMEQLRPIIEARLADGTPLNRQDARAKGRASVHDFLTKETARLAEQQRFRDFKVGEWFDKQMAIASPRVFALVKSQGPGWAVLFKLLGWKLTASDGMDRGIPFTLCTIKRWGTLRAGIRMLWEDPEGKGIPHERRKA